MENSRNVGINEEKKNGERQSLFDFCRRLGLSEGAAEICRAYAQNDGAVQAAYRLLCAGPEVFLRRLAQGPQAPRRSLALYAQFAQMLWPCYRGRGISRRVYLDTFADLALWEEEFFAANGFHGLAETEWLAYHARMELFRLGSLQFQPPRGPLHAVWKPAEIGDGELALYLHIPKGADLGSEAVRRSYESALEFWGCDSAVLLCESWLLAPQLKALLPPQSRISAFASGFFIAAVDSSSRQAEERLFGCVEDDPGRYPSEGTSLQAAARRHLLAGGTLPSAYGWQRIRRP